MSPAPSSHRERLSAPWGIWVVASVVVATLGLAVGYPLGWVAGIAATVVAEAVVVYVLVSAAALVAVEPDALVAGRARLSYDAMGAVTALGPSAAALLRGREADARAYLLLRPWVQPAVRVDVVDPEDPAPYWYVSTRRPVDLAAALADARTSAARRHDGDHVDEAG